MTPSEDVQKPNWILIFGGFGVIALIIFVAMLLKTVGDARSIESLLQKNQVDITQQTIGEEWITQQGGVPRISAYDHARGAQNPSVIWIEYADFECPYCKLYHEELKQLLTAYPNDVQVVFRHYPLSIHEGAYEKAIASECVAALSGEEAFWRFHDMLYDRAAIDGTGISTADLSSYAAELGIASNAFTSCMASGEFTKRVQSDIATGDAAGVTGTPTTMIVAKDGSASLIPGVIDFTSMKEVMEVLRTGGVTAQ